jgi:predicted DNA-binding transcriptional regulator YafY
MKLLAKFNPPLRAGISLSDLAGYLEVGTQTVRRDLKAFEAAGFRVALRPRESVTETMVILGLEWPTE